MKAKYVALNLALTVAILVASWQAGTHRKEARAARERAVLAPVKTLAVLPPAPVPLPEAASAAHYAEVATNDLFSRDRNPTIVIEPPKVEKPKEMPPLPVIYGVLGLPSGTRALMSDRAGVTGKPVHAGDMVGEFKILTLDTRDVTIQWESRVIARRVEDLIDRGSHSDAAPNVAAAAASAGAAPVATNLYDAQLRDQTARAQGNAPPLQPVTPGGSIGAEVGSAGHSERACRPGDTSPAGTVVDGYRKILIPTPFGANCRWTPVQ